MARYVDIENQDDLPTLMRFDSIKTLECWIEVCNKQGWNISESNFRITDGGAVANKTRRGIYGGDQFRKLRVMTLDVVTNPDNNMQQMYFDDDNGYTIRAEDVRWNNRIGFL
jgi:hypothetical protein